MSKDLRDVMEAVDKRIKETDHPLAKLWRTLLLNGDIGIEQWDKLTMRYYRSPYSRIKKNATDIASDKNNFYRSMGAPVITWKNFFKALCILSPVSIRFDLTLTWNNGKNVTASFFTKNPMPLYDEQMLLMPIEHKARRSVRRNVKNGPLTLGLDEETLTKPHMSLRRKLAERDNVKKLGDL